MANGQTYFIARKLFADFINGTSVDYKSVAEIARAAGLNSARTAKNAISGNRVSAGTARALHRLCVRQGFMGGFDEAFDEVR